MQSIKVSKNICDFLYKVKLKKNYLKKLKNKVFLLHHVSLKNNKLISDALNLKTKYLNESDNLVLYIINVTFTRTNTLLNVMDFSGNSKFFFSSGLVFFKGKNKKSRFSVFKELYKVLLLKSKTIKFKPSILHLNNVGSHKLWIINMLKKKFYIKAIVNYNNISFNGCRSSKIRRKKLK